MIRISRRCNYLVKCIILLIAPLPFHLQYFAEIPLNQLLEDEKNSDIRHFHKRHICNFHTQHEITGTVPSNKNFPFFVILLKSYAR